VLLDVLLDEALLVDEAWLQGYALAIDIMDLAR
jgi:hypothetical protein